MNVDKSEAWHWQGLWRLTIGATRSVASLLFVAGMVMADPSAQATTSVWYGDDPELESTWTTDGNWYSAAAPSPGDILVFGGSQQNNINDFPPNTSFDSINFTNDGWTITGNAITLTSTGSVYWSQSAVPDSANVLGMPVTFTAPATIGDLVPGGTLILSGPLTNGDNLLTVGDVPGATVILNGAIIGAGGLTKTGGGLLQLGNLGNAYGGDTTVAGGTLRLGANSVIPGGTGSGNVVVNATLDLNGTSAAINGLSGSGGVTNSSSVIANLTLCSDNVATTFTFDGYIQGPLNLFKVLPLPTLVLTRPNTYTGNTTHMNGALRLGTNNALPPTTFLTIGFRSNDALVDLAGYSQQVAGLLKNTTGTCIITNSSPVNDSTLIFSNATAPSTYLGRFVDGVTKKMNVTVAGGILTLNQAASTYTGLTLVTNSGSELIVSTAQSGGGPFMVADGANLGVTVTTPNSALRMASLSLGDSPAHHGALTIDLGTFHNPTNAPISATNFFVNGTVSVNVSGPSLRLGQFPLIRYAGAIGGAGFGAFTVGSLPLGVTAVLVDNTNNSSVDLKIIQYAGSLAWVGATPLGPASSWDIGLTTNWLDLGTDLPAAYTEKSISGPVLFFDDTATNSTVNLTATVKPFFVTVSNTALSYSISGPGQITGSGSLVKDGPGLLVLASANTYTGDTVISNGTVRLGANSVIPSGNGVGNLNLDGTLDLGGFAVTVNGLSGSGTVDNTSGNGTLSVGANAQSSTFSGNITNTTGSVSLTKLGAGTLTLAGVNTYSGQTRVMAGTLAAMTAGLPSGGLSVSNGGTFSLALSSATDGLSISGLALGTGGSDTTTNNFDFSVFGNRSRPVIYATNLAANGMSIINIKGSGFSVGQLPLIQYQGVLGGGGSFVLGTLPLGLGAYLSNAPLAVTLVVTNPANLVWTAAQDSNWDIGTTLNWQLNNTPLVYQDGETVLFDSRGIFGNQVTLVTDVAPGGVTVNNPSNDYIFNGPGRLTGPMGMTKSGAGTLTLNSPNTFTGSTLINAGVLQLGTNGSISNSASIVVASNAVLDVSAISSGLIIADGNSLGGYGTIIGAVTVAAGATVAPGPFPGTATFQSSLSLQGTAVMQTRKSGSQLSSTKLAVNSFLTYGAASTLTVVHSGDALVGGETFNLFSAAAFDGAFYSWNLPPLSAGLNWCLNRLTTDGTLSVNRAPITVNLAVQTTPGIPLSISAASLLALCSDPDNDLLHLISVGSPGHGMAWLDADCTTLVYMPDMTYTGLDEFTYTISDGRGGLSTGTNSVLVTSPGSSEYNRFSLPSQPGGKLAVSLAGFPGYSYVIQRSTNLVDWVDVLTNVVPSNGLLSFQDPSLPSPPPLRAFYRAVFQLGAAESQSAGIIQATGVKGGFVAHVGCGDGRLTAALHSSSSFMVQGLDQNPANVAAARAYIKSLGLYGPVSADQWDGAHLPYIDGFANLVVVEDMGTMTTNEIDRVLAPLGVAYIQNGGSWTQMMKPRPAAIDDWTHYEYDATGVCVAQDTVVGPPKRYQWLAGPRFNRHHDVMSSFNAGVSANGRLFHVMDEGSRESVLLPGKWTLIARDAFNGTLLWKRPISSWHPSMYGLKSGPAQLPHRLVAVGDVVYVTLDYYGPVVALDAATGATIQTYNQTAAAQEIYWSSGTLFVLVDPNPKQWAIWENYYNTSVSLRGVPSTWWMDHPRVLTALNASTGQLLWTNTSYVYPTSIAADASGVIFHDGIYIVKLDRNDGHRLWQSSTNVPVLDPTFTANGLSMILYQDTVLMAGGPGGPGTDQSQNLNGYIWSVDSTSGQVLTNWTHGRNSHVHSPNDLFVLNDLVWSTAAAANDPICTGYDRRTGAVVTTIDPHLNITWIHERCYRSKATTRYFITSRACLEMMDTQQTNSAVQDDWVRSACLYGYIPCNGLLYSTPNDCACQFEAKLTGLCALAPASTDTNYPPTDPDAIRLQPGPAYGQPVPANPSPDDWPVYRHDQVRSGYTTNNVPATLGVGWQATLGGKLSSLTVAEGKVFVATVDTHTVWAFDAVTGSNVWSFMAGGRVDSPPTISYGRVLFGAADGYVYCLRATDGALIWRFLGAPTDLRHMSYEQIESVWPVSGSVLVQNDQVYCVAGRQMYLDGGCRFLILNPTNGVKLVENVMDDKVPGSTNSLATLEKNFDGPVALADLLSSDGQHIFMKSQWFDLAGVRTNIGPISGDVTINADWANQVGDGVHLFTPTGFLDDTWMHRSYWVWGRSWSSGAGGYYQAGRHAPCGQILSIDEANVYGFGRMPQFYQWTLPKENMLFSTSSANAFYTSNPYNWTNTLPFVVKAMVVAGNSIFLAGPPELEDEEQSFGTLNASQTQVVLANQDAALNGADGGQLRVVDKTSGNTLAMYNVNFLPVWDGMAAANQSLYLATRDGRVLCLR